MKRVIVFFLCCLLSGMVLPLERRLASVAEIPLSVALTVNSMRCPIPHCNQSIDGRSINS